MWSLKVFWRRTGRRQWSHSRSGEVQQEVLFSTPLSSLVSTYTLNQPSSTWIWWKFENWYRFSGFVTKSRGSDHFSRFREKYFNNKTSLYCVRLREPSDFRTESLSVVVFVSFEGTVETKVRGTKSIVHGGWVYIKVNSRGICWHH